MTTNIFDIHEMYFSLYKMMYKKNVCCNYIRRYIITTNIYVIHESVYRLI